jgi:hypothetical protein
MTIPRSIHESQVRLLFRFCRPRTTTPPRHQPRGSGPGAALSSARVVRGPVAGVVLRFPSHRVVHHASDCEARSAATPIACGDGAVSRRHNTRNTRKSTHLRSDQCEHRACHDAVAWSRPPRREGHARRVTGRRATGSDSSEDEIHSQNERGVSRGRSIIAHDVSRVCRISRFVFHALSSLISRDVR